MPKIPAPRPLLTDPASPAHAPLAVILSSMKMLALETAVPGTQQTQFTPDLLRAEAEAAWQLHLRDIVREFYFRADRHEAVLVLECDRVEDAHRHLAEFPMVRAGLIAFEVIPLVAYTGFARLFAASM